MALDSYTVGYSEDLVSDKPETLLGNNSWGVVVPSHVSKSCLDESHVQLNFNAVLASNSMLEAMIGDLTNEIFESFSESTIEYNTRDITCKSINFASM